MKRILYVLVIIVLVAYLPSAGQELNTRVEINYKQMQSKIQYEEGLFQEMQSKIQDLMNNTRWSTDMFSQNEKIEVNLTINLMQSSSQNVFNGNARFQVARPVYGTDYKSVSFQYVDQNFAFSYQPVERQMVFNEQGFTSNITSLAGFYSLLALAIDYDSFSNLGGSPFVQRLFNVVQLAQNQGAGWSQSEKSQRNRYWLVENLQNQQLARFREGFYTFHRIILDDFGKDPEKARIETLKLLETIQNIVTLRQNSILINAFFDAKATELINIFSVGFPQEKEKAFLLLSGMDPDKTEQYRKIVSG